VDLKDASGLDGLGGLAVTWLVGTDLVGSQDWCIGWEAWMRAVEFEGWGICKRPNACASFRGC
jgi:hypothetical protein